ncbi:MAG: hypothetical protein M1826_006930 [Phylliscum demangeonii]|nr:MAG: hypothetical protein M1826_006930 [Phylliscum demangeonii]
MDDQANTRDELVVRFCELTGALPIEAQQFLDANHWEINAAVNDYFTSPEIDEEGSEEDDLGPPGPPLLSGGGRTLGGDPGPVPVPPPTSSTTQPTTNTRRDPHSRTPRVATLSDINRDRGGHSHGHGPGHSHGHGPGHGHGRGDDDEDDDDDDDDDERHNMFAGGEKSALALKFPADARRSAKDILNKAARSVHALRAGNAERAESYSGRAATRDPEPGTLGGDDAPSTSVPAAHPVGEQEPPRVTRILHFWQNGFSIEDGPLYRFDDRASARILALIKSGAAPLDVMGVEQDQPVDVHVQKHAEDYAPLKRAYKPFSGGGQRLGSPTPGVSVSISSSGAGSPAPARAAPAAAAAPVARDGPVPSTVDVDDTQPTVSLQIRLGDGARLASRFNLTHTIGAVYDFVNASSPASAQRPWVLMTTFPSKELVDRDVALGDLPEFKRGGVVVQKWR